MQQTVLAGDSGWLGKSDQDGSRRGGRRTCQLCMAWLCSQHTGKDVRFPPTLQFLQLKVKLGKLDFLLGVPVQTAQQETSTTLPRPSLTGCTCDGAVRRPVKFNISISAVHSRSCFVGKIQSLQDSFEGASPKAMIYFSRMRSGGFPFIV